MTRVGLIVPSSNTVAEVDFYRHLPGDATVHTARVYLEETTPEAEAVMLDEHLEPAVRDLRTARPDLMVFACTSGGALRGNAYEADLIARIAQKTGAETISVAASVRRAIAKRQARRVGVITPYVPALDEKIAASLAAEGVEVVGIRGLGLTENFAIASVEPERIAQFANECFDGHDIDLLFASCTNFRAVDAREQMERALGVPVVTSNQAALEAVSDHLNG
jgi:maleate isomerase